MGEFDDGVSFYPLRSVSARADEMVCCIGRRSISGTTSILFRCRGLSSMATCCCNSSRWRSKRGRARGRSWRISMLLHCRKSCDKNETATGERRRQGAVGKCKVPSWRQQRGIAGVPSSSTPGQAAKATTAWNHSKRHRFPSHHPRRRRHHPRLPCLLASRLRHHPSSSPPPHPSTRSLKNKMNYRPCRNRASPWWLPPEGMRTRQGA
jgi:hypothetical protein